MNMQAIFKLLREADMATPTPELADALNNLIKHMFITALDEIKTGPMALVHPDYFDAIRSGEALKRIILVTTPVYIASSEDEGFMEKIIDQLMSGPGDLATQVAGIWDNYELPKVPVVRYPQTYMNVIAATVEAHVSCEMAFVHVRNLGVDAEG